MSIESRRSLSWFSGRHDGRQRDRPRGELTRTLQSLGSLFRTTPGNFFLRGSAARDESIVNDIDIIEIRSSERAAPRDLPASLHDLPIEYATISAIDFEQYFTVRLRPVNDLFETLVIKADDHSWIARYELVKRHVSSESLPAYLLHLYLEDRYIENFYAWLEPSASAPYLKSLPGSKRTLLRYYCAARCIARDFSVRPMHLVVSDCERHGLLPAGFNRRFEDVSRAIHSGDVGAVRALARDVVSWRTPYLLDPILSEVKDRLSREVVSAVLDLADQETRGPHLRRAENLADALAPDLQWLLWLGLSAHRHTPVDVLQRLYDRCARSYVYKDIVRNLARNASCPSSVIDGPMHRNDQDVQRFLHERDRHHA